VKHSLDARRLVAGRVLPVLTVVGLAVGASACGGSKSAVSADSSTTSTSTTSSSTTSTTAPRQPCTPDHLAAAAAAEYPGATVEDVTCSAAFAVATLQSGRLSGGSGMAFFGTGPDGAWALLRVGPVDGDLNADLPAGLPASLPNGWKSRYDARINKPTTPSSWDNSADGAPAPTEPPTTEPPPTDPPPTDAPPEDPAPSE
jgi:ABC-type glycerol-3-phosphate transport system substrate-binding protein